MGNLDFLPQGRVVWGRQVLPDAMSTLNDNGFEKPITFTIKELASLNRTYVAPNVIGGVGTFESLPPHVPDFAVMEGLKACIDAGARSILALGGGSVLDAAKAVSHLHQKRTGQYLPIAALPTTLSGSEFSHFFGITETDREVKFKRSYAVRGTTPSLVVIDPELIRGTPRSLLLSSAIKGIDHAVEGMRKIEADHPHAILASRGARRFLDVLSRWPAAIETNEALATGLVNHEDLLQLQLASWHSYFFPASVVYGLSHRIGHILGGTYGLPHSITSCITLAPVIRACGDFYGGKLETFRSGTESGSAAGSLANDIEAAVLNLGLPTRLRDLNFDEGGLDGVHALLCEHYPDEVSDLGDDARTRLSSLLREIW